MDSYEQVIRSLIGQGLTYREVSNILSTITGQYSGFSQRSVRRFCEQRGIQSRRRGRIDGSCLDRITGHFINRVGHSFRRRTMHGLLASWGFMVSQTRVERSLSRLAPIQHAQRRHDTHRMLNSPPCCASYLGRNCFLTRQREKCVMFGATHVLAIDGYSRKIVGFITLPKKNAVHMYDVLFRPLLLSEGLWEQVRVDHGSEFALVLTSQQLLSPYRRSTCHLPVLQSLSRQNHWAQRIWPERVNYPLKLANGKQWRDFYRRQCYQVQCLLGCDLCDGESNKDLISAWNSHRIPGRNGGIPNQLALYNEITPLSHSVVPSTA